MAVMSQSCLNMEAMNEAGAGSAENSGANTLAPATAIAGIRDPPTKVLTLFCARFARAITSILIFITSPYFRSSSFRTCLIWKTLFFVRLSLIKQSLASTELRSRRKLKICLNNYVINSVTARERLIKR